MRIKGSSPENHRNRERRCRLRTGILLLLSKYNFRANVDVSVLLPAYSIKLRIFR